ncbi:hypothetical protein CVT24_001570 [Panaeolus cyanescens]|uniref:F-box domain-containing protein n=1 Tax=Panaeolus cyanescens TaxID=181874 RepID=A0A409YFG6_9AGAR|nr:hypothetical protein CVT24_001570 [Panaeolus cyanescens]
MVGGPTTDSFQASSALNDGPLSNSMLHGAKRNASELSDEENVDITANKKLKTDTSANEQPFVITEMPVEILLEIIEHLQPTDVVALGQTSKSFSAFLSSPMVETLWIRLRSTFFLPPPDRPSAMSEHQYAELLFGNACMECKNSESKPENPVYRIWDAWTRLCNKCVVSTFTLLVKKGKKRENVLAQMFNIPKQLSLFIPECLAIGLNAINQKMPRNFVPVRQALLWSQEYLSLQTPGEKALWLKSEMEKQINIQRLAKKCSDWHQRLLATYAAQRRQAVRERQERIKDTVKKMGWAEELSKMYSNFPHQQPNVVDICQKDLDDAVIESLKPFLDDFMHKAKEARLHRERQALLYNCFSKRIRMLNEAYEEALEKYATYEPRPRAADVFTIPRIRSLVVDTPLEVQLTKDAFNITTSCIPTLLEEANDVIKSKMLALVQEGLADKTYDPTTVLDLATTVFCNYLKSQSGFTAAEAIRHPDSCIVHRSDLDNKADEKAACGVFRQDAWNGFPGISFDRESHDKICQLMELCGLDPATTTLAQMNEVNPVFECIPCNKLTTGRLVMSWSLAVKSFCVLSFLCLLTNWVVVLQARHREHFSHSEPVKLIHLTGDEAAQAQEGIKDALERRMYSKKNNHDDDDERHISCLHCKYKLPSMKYMRPHLDEAHQIPFPTLGIDFRFDYLTEKNPNSGSPYAKYRLWPPRAREHRRTGGPSWFGDDIARDSSVFRDTSTEDSDW